LSEEEARNLIKRAVQLANQARDAYEKETGKHNYVAGSIGPYGAYLADGSEYRGDYDLTAIQLQNFHLPRLAAILATGVDCLALETQPKLTEVVAILALLKTLEPTRHLKKKSILYTSPSPRYKKQNRIPSCSCKKTIKR
ncbi:homocysteine S-methyltransferase family protein, partial [Escherichia coli]